MGKPYECFSDFYVCISRYEDSKLQNLMVLTITLFFFFLTKSTYSIADVIG